METTKHINPDHYLETEQGRLFTPERSAAAWELAYRDLDKALCASSPATKLYVVVGVQAAGKSSWIQQNAVALGGDAVFFDAALPKAVHRDAFHSDRQITWGAGSLYLAQSRFADRLAEEYAAASRSPSAGAGHSQRVCHVRAAE